MFSVLRIEADERRVAGYISRINEIRPESNAHIDRRDCIVADLSAEETDWTKHLGQVSRAIAALGVVLLDAQVVGDKVVVDIALDPRTEFAPGVQMTVDSHRFPPGVLRQMSELNVILEVTITSTRF